ncbi:Heat shock transcription factor, Y-linked [Halotydeus destructor]|nr:Heat shock transcription factor, Y-linked [Halotydeus destructor]
MCTPFSFFGAFNDIPSGCLDDYVHLASHQNEILKDVEEKLNAIAKSSDGPLNGRTESSQDRLKRRFKENRNPSKSQKFPKKLFKLANECQTGAIGWTNDGSAIVVNYYLFRTEFLDTGYFKTKNISSFIRQLNLYGFRKVNPNNGNPLDDRLFHVFKHNDFKRGQEEHLVLVQRTLNVKGEGKWRRCDAKTQPQSPVRKLVEEKEVENLVITLDDSSEDIETEEVIYLTC